MERELTLLVVWTLVASSYIQAIVHFITWWTLHRQSYETSVGDALNKREFTLGLKATARGFFDLLLAVLVTWGFYYIGNGLARQGFFTIVALMAFVSIHFGLRFLFALQDENFGQPDYRQDIREVEQNEREVEQNGREAEQNTRDIATDRRNDRTRDGFP